MPLDEAESQILAMLYALETRAEEWWQGRRGRLTREQLRAHAERFWADELEPWQGRVEGLAARGLLVEQGGELALAPAGHGPARELRAAYRRRRFDDVLSQAERSGTYLTFCRRTSDLDLRVFSPLDAAQLEAVFEALDLQPGERLLDAGCGAGHVAEWLAGRLRTPAPGVDVVGIDQAAAAIRLARERTAGLRQVDFAVWDFAEAASPAPEGRFDAVLAIDSLAFVDDLEAALRRLLATLAPGGRLVALTLEAAGAPDEAPTARALAALGLQPQVRDLSETALPILRARSFAVRALRNSFRREGCGLLARVLSQEADRLAPLLAAGRLRRRLYRVAVPNASSGRRGSSSRRRG